MNWKHKVEWFECEACEGAGRVSRRMAGDDVTGAWTEPCQECRGVGAMHRRVVPENAEAVKALGLKCGEEDCK